MFNFAAMFNYAAAQPKIAGNTIEMAWQDGSYLDRAFFHLKAKVEILSQAIFKSNLRTAKAVVKQSDLLTPLDEKALNEALQQLSAKLKTQGLTQRNVVQAFAIIREYSGRTLGMRHHITQIQASLILLKGEVAEMATGEGKTLAASLAAATAAIAGIPVHVITVNDYLAERDATSLIPLYKALGISVDFITREASVGDRRSAYACDICYCSNKELVFDYLKDQILLGGNKSTPKRHSLLLRGEKTACSTMQRGLHFAIVDEADSIFIDEARTPLIISGGGGLSLVEKDILLKAVAIARELEESKHYIFESAKQIKLTEQGKNYLEAICSSLAGVWLSPFYREPVVEKALSALSCFKLDRDYIIDEEGKVQIIDPNTGRIMPGRSWGQGLQQMVEMKEGLSLTEPNQTKAEISYQNFFRKYHHLCGMTGTVKEVSQELRTVYRINTQCVPLLNKSKRKHCFKEVYVFRDRKWARVAEIVSQEIAAGRAVLIGTGSIESSEKASAHLSALGIGHQVLNARQDEKEAMIISQAGASGAVTVATSMAGRGTDIKLSEVTKKAGGLHVIITELQESPRIDRQLAGRCARQGDPGMVSQILSLEDSYIEGYSNQLMFSLMKTMVGALGGYFNGLGFFYLQRQQRHFEKKLKNIRMSLLKNDVHRQKLLAFTGNK